MENTGNSVRDPQAAKPPQPLVPDGPTVALPLPGASAAAGRGAGVEQEVLEQKLGPYRITGFLGRGGMALVYAARDPDGATVALKVMQESPFVPAGTLERFRREASASKLLRQHPHILTVYDTGQEGRNHYIAMELILGGRTLSDVLREHQNRVPLKDALRLGLEVAEALQFAHEHEIIHRDLKPANVLVDEFQRARLADFGLARMDTGVDLTLTSMALGTPSYMAPEQTVSAKTTKLSDIYSFGVLLYLLVTGSMPYEFPENPSLGQSFEVVRKAPPRKPRAMRREVSRDLEAVLLTLLAKDPRDRYRDMAAVVRDLRACLEGGGRVSVRVPTVFERFDRFLVRHRAFSAGLAALSLTIFLGTKLYQRHQARAAADRLKLQGLAVSADNQVEALRDQLAGPGQTDPDEALYEAGLAALRAGEPAVAMEKLRQLLARPGLAAENSGLAEAAGRELGRAALAAGDYHEAAARFGAIAAANPSSPPGQLAVFELGVAQMLAGDMLGAEKAWRGLLARKEVLPALATLCRGALGEMSPEDTVGALAQDLRLFRCLGWWLAARQVNNAAWRREWLAAASDSAETSLPWLRCHISAMERSGDETQLQSGPNSQ